MVYKKVICISSKEGNCMDNTCYHGKKHIINKTVCFTEYNCLHHRGNDNVICVQYYKPSDDIDDLFDDLLEEFGGDIKAPIKNERVKELKKKYYKEEEIWGDYGVWTT